MRINDERPDDAPAREALLDRCFGPERHFKSVERLRRGQLPAVRLALAAREGGELIGTVRLWDVEAGSAGPALLLGPVAVAPARQGQTVGSALIRHALDRADWLGHRAVLLVGDASYYARFGFRPEAALGLDLPGPVDRARFLGLELVPGALVNARGAVAATGRPDLPRAGHRRRRAA